MLDPIAPAQAPAARRLAKTIGVTGFFTLAFGSIVGSGWVLTLGEWLTRAAPGGTLLALMTGGAVIVAIGACYAELATRLPRAGGEILYVLESFGPFPAFIVGWFIALNAIATWAFEGIALGWFLATLFPDAQLALPRTVLGHPFDVQSWLIGVIGAAAVGLVHCAGSRTAMRFQNLFTFSFLAIMVLLIAVGIVGGHIQNLSPLFERADGTSPVGGILWVFATSGFFLNGFQTAVHALEERRATLSARSAARAMLLAIVAAAAFYCLLVLAAGFAAPWRDTIRFDLPAVAAFGRLSFGRALAAITLAAATVSLLKTWTAVSLMASRILFAQARMGFLPPLFARVDMARGAPTVAILFVTGCTIIGLSLGRQFVSAIVNMSAICMSITFVVCILCLLRQRKRQQASSSLEVPGGRPTILLALCGASVMACVAFFDPLLGAGGHIPLQWWLLLLWAALGVVSWTVSRRMAAVRIT